MLTMHALAGVLKPGDLIFTRYNNFIYHRVADAYQSWLTHIGIVYSVDDREVIIAESVFPWSKLTKLETFISKSDRGQFAVKRFKQELNETELLAMRRHVNLSLRQRYGLRFNYSAEKTTYCSKFAYQLFRAATDRQLGHVETMADLLQANPQASLNFWRLYFFGKIPWEQKVITPASQYRDPQLRSVCEYLIGDGR